MRRIDWESERAPSGSLTWPGLDALVAQVADEHAHTVAAIVGRVGFKSIRLARAEFCRRAHAAGYSWPEIGAFLHRHHSTVMAVSDGRKNKRARVAA